MIQATILITSFLILPFSYAIKYTVYTPRSFNDYNANSNYIMSDREDSSVKDLMYRDVGQFKPMSNAIPDLPLPLYFLNNAKKNNRKIGGKKKVKESSIFYIRLPPTPYMMVPGLGYVSQPPSITPLLGAIPSAPASDPISFNNDGYVSDSSYGEYMNNLKPVSKKKMKKSSKIERLSGLFYFNGRPDKVLILPSNEAVLQ